MNKKFTDVLILNRNWVACQVVDFKKAMSLIYQEAARPLDRDFLSYSFQDWLAFSNAPISNDYPKVHTSTKQIALPEIIVLTKYDRLPIRDVKYSRQTIFEIAGFRCAYCLEPLARSELTVDHVIPKSKGGKTTFDNTVSCCKPCNSLKADRTPEQAGMVLRIKPKKPKWISPLHKVGRKNMLKSWIRFMDRTPTE